MVGNLERFQQNYNRIKMDTIMLHSRKYVSNSTYVQLSNFPTAVVFGNNNSNPYDHILSSKPPNLYRNSGPSVYVRNFSQWLLKLWRTGLKAFYEKLFPLTNRLLFRWGWSKITFLWLMRLFIFWKWRRKETTGSWPLNRILIKLAWRTAGMSLFSTNHDMVLYPALSSDSESLESPGSPSGGCNRPQLPKCSSSTQTNGVYLADDGVVWSKRRRKRLR